jgi:putative chitinase
MVSITEQQLRRLAPNIRQAYAQAFSDADTVLAAYAVNATPLRLAHFMAQVLHESGGLTVLVENMNYRAARIREVWPSRFPTVASAEPYAHKPEKLANKVYSNRMGNGGPASGDGWRFRGHGLLQITGRDAYEKYGTRLGIPLASDPDLAVSGEWALKIAAEEWKASGCNALADEDSIRKVTRAINGGLIGLASRTEWLAKTKHEWRP